MQSVGKSLIPSFQPRVAPWYMSRAARPCTSPGISSAACRAKAAVLVCHPGRHVSPCGALRVATHPRIAPRAYRRGATRRRHAALVSPHCSCNRTSFFVWRHSTAACCTGAPAQHRPAAGLRPPAKRPRDSQVTYPPARRPAAGAAMAFDPRHRPSDLSLGTGRVLACCHEP